MTRPKRPTLKPDEHPRPQVMVPMSIFGDLFFSDNHERVGRWLHKWTFAVWKKDPAFHGFMDDDAQETALALRHGWLVDSRGRLRLTGPNKDKRWLLGVRKEWWTYAIEAIDQSLVKVGHTIHVERRLDELQCASPHELRLLGSVRGDHERQLHYRMHEHRVSGEWFALNDKTLGILRDARLAP